MSAPDRYTTGDRANVGNKSLRSGCLDSLDRKIITRLQRDGRRAYGAIAEEIGLSEAAVRRRVQRLKDSGVMQIVAITDPLQLGYGREALIGIRVHGDVRVVADKVAAIDEANYVVLTAGSFDIIAEVIAEDDNDLVHLLNDSIRSIPGWRPKSRPFVAQV